MRVTNNMLSYNLLRNLQAAAGRMDKLQNQMSSGLKITRPSDDPVGIENALRMRSTISHVEQWKSNAKEGMAYLDSVDDTLGEMTSMIQRAKELAIDGSNGTKAPEDRQKIAIEVDQIKEQLIQLANSKVGTKYIFGGTANVQPFPPGETEWKGSDDILKFQVGSNLNLEISVNGQDLFGVDPDSTGDKTQIKMLELLDTLSTTLKNSGTSATFTVDIQKSIEDLELQADHIVDFRAQIGARQNRMDSIYQQLDSTSANLSDSLATTLYADIAETLVSFKAQENVYQAALAVGAQIIQPSLVDFMR